MASSSLPEPDPLPPPPATPDFWRACQQLSHHFDNIPLAAILWDHEFRVVRWNEHAERLFGWSAAEVLGRQPGPDWGILPPGEWEAVVAAATEQARSGGSRTVVVTNRNLTRSGELRWVEWRNSVHTDPAGKMTSVLSLAVDVTDRLAALDDRARNEAWVRAALDGADMLGWELDLVTNRWVTTADIPAFYGLPRGPDYSDPEVSLQAIHPDDVPAVRAGRARAIETGEPMRYEFRGRVPAADGSVRWFSTKGQVQRDPDGRPVRLIAVTSDVTERKRAEAERAAIDRQLLDAQKLESIGVLAGGVAHDFNNILTVVLGNAGLARKALPPGSPAAANFDQIEQACRRAAHLCRQLVAYSGRGHVPTGTADLNDIIRSSEALLAVPASRSVRLRFDLADELPVVLADPAQVRQVLMNLMMNAAEALGDVPGEVVVATRRADVAVGETAGYHLPPAAGRYVVLTVTDTGPGIPADVLPRVFDPFFTTKFAGRGLGLSAVLGIMRAHAGAIRVETAVGRGTAVAVLWPAGGEPAPAAPAATSAPAARRSAGKALVVDDEMFVREVTASTLEELGYDPLLAADGASALELFRRYRDEIRVAVLDVMMPGMTGDQVLEELRRTAPRLPAVLVSGFTDRRVIRPDAARWTEFLQKPFHPEELSAVVRRVVPE